MSCAFMCTQTYTAKHPHLNITARAPFIFHTSAKTASEFTASLIANQAHFENVGRKHTRRQDCMCTHSRKQRGWCHACRRACTYNQPDKTNQQLKNRLWIRRDKSCLKCHQSHCCRHVSLLYKWLHKASCAFLASFYSTEISLRIAMPAQTTGVIINSYHDNVLHFLLPPLNLTISCQTGGLSSPE